MKKTLIHSLTFPPDTISTGMIVSKIAKVMNNTQSNIEILASSPQYNLKNSAEFSKINSKIYPNFACHLFHKRLQKFTWG